MTRTAPPGRVAYVLKGYPRLSEVFITSEIYRTGAPRGAVAPVRAEGGRRGRPARRRTARPGPARLPAADDLAVRDRAVPRGCATNGEAFRPALLRTARRHPVGTARAAGRALAQAVRARRGFSTRPARSTSRSSCSRSTSPTGSTPPATCVRLHAHFAHGTTTVTWLASTITGMPFSFTGHAKDIYTEELNPAGLLRRKMDAASFVVTCTEANRTHLASFGSWTPVHVVYHGLNADFEPLVAGGCATGRAGRGCACSRSGGWSGRRAWTPSWTPARCCAAGVWTSRPSSPASPATTSSRFAPGWPPPGSRTG